MADVILFSHVLNEATGNRFSAPAANNRFTVRTVAFSETARALIELAIELPTDHGTPRVHELYNVEQCDELIQTLSVARDAMRLHNEAKAMRERLPWQL